MNLLQRYQEKLSSMPPPGCGCHPALLAIASSGVLAGVDAERIFQDIRCSIPHGSRKIPDREIIDAVNKALSGHNDGSFTPRPRPAPVVRDGTTALQKIIAQGKISDEADLWEASLLRLWEEPKDDPAFLLEKLYDKTDLRWIGDRCDEGIIGKTIRTSSDWIIYFRNGGAMSPFIIINPLNGIPTPTKTGDKTTMRGDACVLSYRYCMAEFDNLSREDQIKFWSGVKLPIVALIDSGGKSIHAWLDVSKMATVTTSEQWQSEIKGRLYDRILTLLGVDSACSNPARLSRLPGHYRTEKGAHQRILWLSAEGRTIC